MARAGARPSGATCAARSRTRLRRTRPGGGGAVRPAWRTEERVSLINRMLQDLDRRQGMASADAGVVRAPAARPASREWFWRVLVVLLTAALAWMGWVAIQLLPRKPLATDVAYLAASEARSRPPEKPASPPAAQVPAP